jgi:hypothetical protein
MTGLHPCPVCSAETLPRDCEPDIVAATGLPLEGVRQMLVLARAVQWIGKEHYEQLLEDSPSHPTREQVVALARSRGMPERQKTRVCVQCVMQAVSVAVR